MNMTRPAALHEIDALRKMRRDMQQHNVIEGGKRVRNVDHPLKGFFKFDWHDLQKFIVDVFMHWIYLVIQTRHTGSITAKYVVDSVGELGGR